MLSARPRPALNKRSLLQIGMQEKKDCSRDKLERELLEQPPFAGGSLFFVRGISAHHSVLMEYRFKSSDSVNTVIVKLQDHGSLSEKTLAEEFGNLGRVRSLLDREWRESVPEPMLVLPKSKILVTRKVPGVPLSGMLRNYGNRLAGPF